MKTEIPQTLREFEIELGKALLVYDCKRHRISASETARLLRTAPTAHHLDVAKKWRKHYRSQLRSLALVARRAQEEAIPHNSLSGDLMHNLYGVMTFLQTVQPHWFGKLFVEGTSQKGEPLQKFLGLLQQLG